MTAVLIHAANVVYLASYSVRDILWLRIFTVLGAVLLMVAFYVRPDPLWEAIGWNVLFVGVNAFQIVLLVRERWPVQLAGLERAIYGLVFQDLKPGEYRQLVRQAQTRLVPAGTTLIADGSAVGELLLVCGGEVAVRRSGREVARLTAGQFVGEMSFLTREPASAEVVAGTEVRVMAWPQEALRRFLQQKPGIAHQLRAILGLDLLKKLQTGSAGGGTAIEIRGLT
jgi:hypothetical protein